MDRIFDEVFFLKDCTYRFAYCGKILCVERKNFERSEEKFFALRKMLFSTVVKSICCGGVQSFPCAALNSVPVGHTKRQ